MKAKDIAAKHIGERVLVEADDVSIEGQLQDLGVITEHVQDGTITQPGVPTAYTVGVILNVAGHELRLHGHEHVTIIKDFLK